MILFVTAENLTAEAAAEGLEELTAFLEEGDEGPGDLRLPPGYAIEVLEA